MMDQTDIAAVQELLFRLRADLTDPRITEAERESLRARIDRWETKLADKMERT